MKSYEGKCYRCELESLVSRGKAKCTYCNNIKKLIIAESGGKYKAFCPDHYCAKHKCAFSKSYRDGIFRGTVIFSPQKMGNLQGVSTCED